jgi:hypothetical protein
MLTGNTTIATIYILLLTKEFRTMFNKFLGGF